MMKNKLSYNTRVLINYGIIAVIFILLSMLGLLVNEWVLIPSMVVCALVGFGVLVLLLNNDVSPDDGSKIKFGASVVIRYLIMIIGLVISGLLVMLTMGEEVNNKRYIMVAIAALPYFIPTLSLMFTKLD